MLASHRKGPGSIPGRDGDGDDLGQVHKVRTYKEYHSVCPSSELGLSQPLSRQRVFPSPQKQGGEGTLACGWGVGGSPISDEGRTLCYSLYVRTLWSSLNKINPEHAKLKHSQFCKVNSICMAEVITTTSEKRFLD